VCAGLYRGQECLKGLADFGHKVMEVQEETMKETPEEQTTIRSYLLGTLDDTAKLHQIEENLLIDDRFGEKLAVAEENLIEEFLDGTLDKVQLEHFNSFFLSAPQRRQQLRLTRNMRKSAGRAAVVTDKKMSFWPNFKSMFSSPFPAFAGVAAVVIISFFGWFVFLRSSETEQITASLNRAYQHQRPFESRVSGLNYAPLGTTRGADKTQVDPRELDKAEDLARDSAAARETAESLRNEGRVFLVKGDFDRAIEALEKAKNLAPQNAEIMSDLGAAQLEQSLSPDMKEKRLDLEHKALANFEKAIELDPDLLAAYFNRALCFQAMHLSGQARDAWQEYLRHDGTSKWADEARRNLELIESTEPRSSTSDEVLQDFLAAYREKDDGKAYRIVSGNREMITGKLIPQRLAFLFLTAAGKDGEEYLSALSYAGRLEKERSGDPYFSDIAKYYSSAAPEKKDLLLDAQRSVNQGYDLCLHNDCKGALDAFKNARDMFSRAGNIWEARFCDYWIGYCLFRSSSVTESTKTLNGLVDFAQLKGYKWLAAQAFSWLAINALSIKEFSGALEYNKKTLDLSAAVSDLYLTEKAYSQLAEVYRRIGDHSQAFGFIYKALEIALQPEASLRQKWRDYDSASNMFFSMKNYSAAAAYKKESVELAAKTNEDTFFFKAYNDLGLIYGTQGKYQEAFEAFAKSREIVAGFSDEDLKKKNYAINMLQTAHVQRQVGSYSDALNSYGQAISFFDNSQFNEFSYDAHKGRLVCYYESKDSAAFQAELPVILDLFQKYRKNIREEQNRNIFFDNEQDVYDFAIAQEFDNSNYDKAFAYSEESRARSLLDLQSSFDKDLQKAFPLEIPLPAGTVEPIKLPEIQARMPANVQLVLYSMLADKTLIWLVAKDRFEVVKTDIASPDLADKASAYMDLLLKNDPANTDRETELAKELYRILISPVEAKLDAGKEICFVRDKILFRLPFSSLVSPGSGKRLISERVIFSSPSANMFLISSDKAFQHKQDAAETLLSVGNPSFNQKDFAGLKPLPHAGKEADDISRLYDHKVLLTEAHATKEKVKENLLRANVFHFAGHYVVNKSWPLLSGLLLAEDGQTHDVKDSLLTNHEITGEKLSNARLIVLSACQTGVERFYNGEGMIGAARSFLATGVPLVVASQWDVDSDMTAELMVRFHRYRKQDGLSTVEALRRSQLDMLEGEDKRYRNPYYWAAFEAIGGYSEF